MKQNGMRERKGRISRYGRRMLAVLLSAGMLLTETLPVFGTENTEETARPHQLYCTVLGDSIAKGYTCDKSWMENYGSLAAKEIAYSEGCRYIYHNYARTGLDTAGLNEKYLSKQDVQTNLAKADVIFITIGSNDLLNECKRVVQEILKTDTKFKSADEALASLKESVKKNPLLVLSAINALNNWDYNSFEKEWIQMMKTVNSLNKDDAKVIVTTIYNPAGNMKLPSTLKFLDVGAFGDCTGLTTINIPPKMKTHDTTAANRQWPGPFYGCKNLKNVTLDNGMEEVPRGIFYVPSGEIGLEAVKISKRRLFPKSWRVLIQKLFRTAKI